MEGADNRCRRQNRHWLRPAVQGDVDSADDNDSESSHTASQPRPIRLAQPLYRRKHETKL
ncbi:hypothetical protein J6590_020677 [Homalodisca vitripennis]|nr:hypothetical protein J6590_020677 [Homalodisca vitripennis]